MKSIIVSGTRKRAISRACLSEGKGIVRINKVPIDNYQPAIYRLKMEEPLILAGEDAKKVNIDVFVRGGGINSQVDAARLVIAKALAKFNKKLEKTFLDYDRQLMVADVRRKEPAKPNRHGQARAKRQKSYR